MKTASFFVILLCLGFVSCDKQKTSSQSDRDIISCIIDRTEANPQIPEGKSIRKSFRVAQGDHTEGAIFRLGEISSIEYSPVATFSLDPQSLLFQNPGGRKKDVAAFFFSIDSALDKLKQLPGGKPQSQIFSVVAREANTISVMPGTRTLYVFSDLIENGSISFYNRSTLEKLKSSPGVVEKQLEALQSIGDLKGLQIVLVYNAPDYENSCRYHLISNAYVKIFETHNAHVTITANL